MSGQWFPFDCGMDKKQFNFKS